MPNRGPASELRLSLARAVTGTGRGFAVGPDNTAGAWAPLEALVDGAGAFAVVPRPGLLVVDLDLEGLDQASAAGRLAVFDRLHAALVAVGVAPVVVASGRAGHRHLFASLGPAAPARRAELEAWLRAHGLDPRARGVRPPLSPHRDPTATPPALVTPPRPEAALAALAAPAPPDAATRLLGALGAPRLSERMHRLVRDGHGDAYASASHARMALALAVAGAGLPPSYLEAVLEDPAAGLGETYRSRPPRWRRAELARLWDKAATRLACSPRSAAITGRPTALAEVERWSSALPAQAWAGMGGATDLAMAEALVAAARRAGGPVLGASLPALALGAGVAAATARRSLRRLALAGWLEVVAAPTATTATVYRLRLPASVTPPVAAPAGTTTGGGELGADLARWAGIGKCAARVLRSLTATPASTAALAAGLRTSPTAAAILLRRLEALGLASRDARGWSRGPAQTASVAERLGVAGTGAAQAAAYAAERAERAELRERWRRARLELDASLAAQDPDACTRAVEVLPARVISAAVGAHARRGPPGPAALAAA